jgi:nitroimidazol reductase NimA-like FMN-containing flavoprotein (pyridoxamine 5'-phosphate oxidase superfamily)
MTQARASADRPASALVRVRRYAKRGLYDRATILSILDAGIMCHVAFNHDDVPTAIPMLYWHDDEYLYIHGSRSSRLINVIAGQSVCVTVTHLDGLVLTRSAFHHAANYRSVCIFGSAEQVEGEQAKIDKLRIMMERLFPGRWDSLRPVRRKELSATRVLAISLAVGSAKIRTGGPVEDSTDVAWPAWGGVMPLATCAGAPEPDAAAVASGARAPTLAVRIERK